MKLKVGDKIVPKGGGWGCVTATMKGADYAIITNTTPTLSGDSYYSYDLYKNHKKVDVCYFCQNETNSKLMERTMEDLQKGDVIVNKSGREVTVIERLGDIVFTTDWENDWNSSFVLNTTELKNKGYTVKRDKLEPTELTMQEVADKFGVDVGKLKIKKG